MTFQRHNPPPPVAGVTTPMTHLLVARQTAGTVFILVVAACALLFVHLPLPRMQLFIMGYGIGLMLFLPGARLAARGRVFGKALLGGGATLLFMTTATVLFDATRSMLPFRFPLHPYGGVILCAAMLVLFAMFAWRARSQSNSLLTAALGLYLLYAVAPLLSPTDIGVLLLIIAAALAGWTWAWAMRQPGRLFTHGTLLLGYAAFIFYGGDAATAGGTASAGTAAGLTLLYAGMTALAVDQGLRDAQRGQRCLALTIINTVLYPATGFVLFADGAAWWLWLVIGALLIMNALAAPTLYMTQGKSTLVSLFSLAAIITLVVALLLPMTPPFRLLIVAAGCVVAAALSHWYDARLLRLTQYALLTAAFAVSFAVEVQTTPVGIGPASIPGFWAWLLGAAGLLLAAAWIHSNARTQKERRGKARAREQDQHALMCAFVAALTIAVHTIMTRGDSEALPFILASQGMVFLGLGLLLFTPAIALAGLAPVFAAHALLYAFPYLVVSGDSLVAAPQPTQTVILGIATLALALYADIFWRDRLDKDARIAERIPAIIPYCPAVALWLLAAHDIVPGVYLAMLAGMAASALLAPRRLFSHGLPGLTMLAFVLAAISVAAFYNALRTGAPPAHALPWYLPLLGMYIVSLVLFERLAVCHVLAPSWTRLPASYGLAFVAAAVGAVGLYHWNSGHIYFLALLGLVLALVFSGRFLRAPAYYYVAALLALFAAGFALVLEGGQVAAARVLLR